MNLISPTSELRDVKGHSLMWHKWHPEGMEPQGSFLLLHGQGDYGQRYNEVADAFLKLQGIIFMVCDLPGHGLSEGKRGHIPSWELAKEVAELALAEGRSLAPNKPAGIGGHSMGGLLALFLLGELEQSPDFSWISSPLLKAFLRSPSLEASCSAAFVLSHAHQDNRHQGDFGAVSRRESGGATGASPAISPACLIAMGTHSTRTLGGRANTTRTLAGSSAHPLDTGS